MSGTKVMTLPTARIAPYQDPVEVAAAGIHQYISDLINAANAATTPTRAVQIRHAIAHLTAEIIGAEMVAMSRADQLVKEM